MGAIRQTLRVHARLALALALLALGLRALVPAGMMVATTASHTLTVTICADATGMSVQRDIVVPMKQTSGQSPGTARHDGAANACPYAGLAMASLAGADEILLAAAFALALVVGLFVGAPAPAYGMPRLRPPLRGPPLSA